MLTPRLMLAAIDSQQRGIGHTLSCHYALLPAAGDSAIFTRCRFISRFDDAAAADFSRSADIR